MSIYSKRKINILLNHWPSGVVMTSRWLSSNGYSFQLVRKYAESGWIKKIGYGAYTKLNDVPKWIGGLCALQDQLQLPIHIGGITAFEINGLGQYLSITGQGPKTIWLYNTTDKRFPLPKWFRLTFGHCLYRQYHLFEQEVGLEQKEIDGVTVMLASPERAILEILKLVPYDFQLSLRV